MASRLERQGLDQAAMRLIQLHELLETAMEGTTWFERNKARMTALLTRHVENAETEVQQTSQLLDVAKRLVIDREAVPADEMAAARAQLLDLLKTLPASAVFAGTLLIPVPGAQPVLLPILMERLGLLPSAWHEPELESGLRDLTKLARSYFLDDVAEELEAMLADVRANSTKIAKLKEYVQEHSDWQVFFDENLDMKVSPEELENLRTRIRDAAADALATPEERLWHAYFRSKGGADATRGPLSFAEVRQQFGHRRDALVRRGDDSWWVPLWALMEELETTAGNRPARQ